ncbi:hypothetical protein HG535_0F00160 [Zygotorulaspora mrakii]|uniref:Pre-rRNA-processing protein ESF2 n=1 Tax=Zygotorulaspora mrakii TaxID=42260 RepID=A0A7H9B550_ZYGMR|nr:uncharacterized protein HG535_0F00160 [Zygotorulaspora mrakii]QLG73506.1 hypothetical protein HG535_0F00160 [Zygotorulaspora mrakii]
MAIESGDHSDFSSDDETSSKNFLIVSKKAGREVDAHLIDEGADEKELSADFAIKSDPQEVQKGVTDEDDAKSSIQRELEKNNHKETVVTKKSSPHDKRTLNATKKLNHKTGVVYLSSIPPYMKPAKMRQILSKFGDVDRLFLRRENEQKHKQRTRGGGNRKVMYEEGWAEFIRKRDAKLCAQTLNGNIIGGKKGSFYHDDILNVKYLPGFKWTDLTEQIARENDIRQSKLEKEITLANKLNAEYAKNVEISRTITNMRKSKKRSSNDDNQIHRNFKQHKVSTTRADAPEHIKNTSSSNELGSVLNNLL